jgi:N-methylhydantoinase B
LKLYKKGVVSEDVLAMIEANIRVPKKTMGDFRAQISGINVGEARFLELCRKYGTDRLTEIIKGVLDHSEAMMRRDLAAYPEGTYSAEGFLDSDGIGDQPVRIAVSVTLKGGTATVDFTGTAAQLKGPFNCSISSVQAAVFCAVRYMVNPSILQNEGCYRPISMVLPEGSLVNPRHPAPLSGRFHSLARIATTIALAFNLARGTEAVGANHGHLSSYSASGRMPGTGETWVIFDILGGGWGGTSRCDGLDAVYDLMANCYDNPVEAMELDYPLRVEQCGFRTDSGGAGRYRGGLGLRKEIRYLHGEGYFTNRSDGQKFPPPGVLGGKSGLPARHALIRSGMRYEALPSKVTNLEIAAEDIIMMETPGGGGYGSPLERDVRRVLDDVLDEKISREAARKVYGLVLTADGSTVDEAATMALRQRLAAVSER